MKSSKYLALASFLFIFHNSFSQGLDSIRYHDGSFESQWGGSGYNTDQFGCFVRFTPATYPDTLKGIEGYFMNGDDTSTIKFKVYFDTNSLAMGGVTPRYISPAPIANPSAYGNLNQAYNIYVDVSASNIVVKKGDIYVGAVEHNNDFFGIARDTNGNGYIDRQWEWYNIFSTNYWVTMNSQLGPGQLGITSYFNHQTATGINTVVTPEKYNIYLDGNNMLNVNAASLSGNMFIRVYDVNGKQVVYQTVRDFNTKINMNSFSSGLYLINIVSPDSYYSHKVVKR